MKEYLKMLSNHLDLLIAGAILALAMNAVVIVIRVSEPGFTIRLLTVVAIGGLSAGFMYLAIRVARQWTVEDMARDPFKHKPEGLED